MACILREMHLPTVAVTMFSEVATGAGLDTATEAVDTCRATFEDGTGADAARVASVATGGGATMAA